MFKVKKLTEVNSVCYFSLGKQISQALGRQITLLFMNYYGHFTSKPFVRHFGVIKLAVHF